MAKIWDEENKFQKMLTIEILVCEAFAQQGKIPAKDLRQIKRKARFNLKRIKEIEEKTKHDVVAFVNNVCAHLGPLAKYLHLGLTSNDILDTTLSWQMVEASDLLKEDLKALQKALAKQARKHRDTVCIGRTHGVHAEPTTFGLKMALYYDEAQRNLTRLAQARQMVRVGKISGAVGTYANISPFVEEYVCKKLGLLRPNLATQVLQRDRHAQYLTTLALIGASLEKIATEIRHLQRSEVLEAEEYFSQGQKGSSAMPHKRNPITCERICGLARILRANALAAIENIPLWHERDISHSSVERVIIPDSTILLDYMLATTAELIEKLVVYPQRMLENLVKTRGLIFSQKVLLKLMEKGLGRTQAYDLVQKLAMRSFQEGKNFQDLLLADRKLACLLSAKEINACFDLKRDLRHVQTIFKRLGL
jgi:adenylosuccinate lyase